MKSFAIIGQNLHYTLSPTIHAIIFDLLGVDARYGVISVKKGELKKIEGALRCLDGFNVTQPHKEDILPYLSKNMDLVPAVNTVSVQNGQLYGYNTDLTAFSSIIAPVFEGLMGACVVVEGAGGMAAAAITALKKYTSNIYIVNRSRANGERLAGVMGVSFADGSTVIEPKVYINCSAKELHEYGYSFAPFIDTSALCFAFDSIYLKTDFISQARAKNIRCENGFEMLIRQAIFAQSAFWGGKYDHITQTDEFKNNVSKRVKAAIEKRAQN